MNVLMHILDEGLQTLYNRSIEWRTLFRNREIQEERSELCADLPDLEMFFFHLRDRSCNRNKRCGGPTAIELRSGCQRLDIWKEDHLLFTHVLLDLTSHALEEHGHRT